MPLPLTGADKGVGTATGFTTGAGSFTTGSVAGFSCAARQEQRRRGIRQWTFIKYMEFKARELAPALADVPP